MQDFCNLIRIFSSDRRTEVLNALLKEESKDKIKKRIPASTYAFIIDYLKNAGLVEENGGNIALTDSGRDCLIIFQQFEKSISTIQRLYESFPDHFIGLPDKFLIRLNELEQFEVICSEPSDILKPHRVFTDYLKKSHEIYGVSPILFPDYPATIEELARKEKKISLVVSAEVFSIISSFPIGNFSNIEIFIADTAPRIAAAVSEKFLSLGFFFKSGSYDYTRDLISTSPRALKFGMDLIEYYRAESNKVVQSIPSH